MHASDAVDLLIELYTLARRGRVPIAEQTPAERGGRYLLRSAALTRDGQASPWGAVRLALAAGEPAAAEVIADVVLPPTPHGGPRVTAAAGEIGGTP